MQRVRTTGATIGLLLAPLAACDRPSAAECDAFAEHLLTVSISSRLEKLSPALRESELEDAMEKKGFLVERCQRELTSREVECARAAQTTDQLERCGW